MSTARILPRGCRLVSRGRLADLGEGRDGWQRIDGIKEEGGWWVGDEMHHGLDVMGTRCEPARREPCATGSQV